MIGLIKNRYIEKSLIRVLQLFANLSLNVATKNVRFPKFKFWDGIFLVIHF